MQYSRDDDVQIISDDKPKPTSQPSRAVAKKSTSRPSLKIQQQQQQSVAVPFLPQVTPNTLSTGITAPPSKIVVSIYYIILKALFIILFIYLFLVLHST